MSYLSCFHSNRVSTKNTSTTCPHGTQQWHCDRAAVQLQLINCDDARLKRNRAYKIILVKPIRFNELHHNHKHKLFTLLEHSETFRACTSSPTSNSNLELPKLVLCFCQKLSGLMMRATWMQDGNDSWRIFNKGLMLSHLEPRISTMTVKPCLATSSLRERKKRGHILWWRVHRCARKKLFSDYISEICNIRLVNLPHLTSYDN